MKKENFKDIPDADKIATECAICMEEFNDADEVGELDCDKRHYFHTKCIEEWIKVKMECPLCKKQIEDKPELVKEESEGPFEDLDEGDKKLPDSR